MFQKSENVPKICLLKCFKGHKSQGSLCSVLKTLIVSGAQPRDRPSKGQGHLLSCCGQLKNRNHDDLVEDPEDLLQIILSLFLSLSFDHQLHKLLEKDKGQIFLHRLPRSRCLTGRCYGLGKH